MGDLSDVLSALVFGFIGFIVLLVVGIGYVIYLWLTPTPELKCIKYDSNNGRCIEKVIEYKNKLYKEIK